MEPAHGTGSSSDDGYRTSQHQLEISFRLLQLVQSDYQRARRQLEEVCSTFGEREQMAGQCLRTALELAAPPRPPALGPAMLLPFLLGVPSTPPSSEVWPTQLPATTLPPLYIRCLGPLEVRLGSKRVESWRSKKAKALFKYLIAQRGRPVSKDVLMETLWPEADPQAANNNLKAAVHALRQTLDSSGKHDSSGDGASYVLFIDGNYVLNPEATLWVDVEELERQWVAGRRLEKEGKPSEATAAYTSAETLYRGDFLEEDSYEEWTLLRREGLKDTYLAILSKLSERSMQEEDWENCIVYCQKILAKDPCREDAYRGLMRCHSRLGHRSRALSWYKICTRTLRAELDTAPDAETTCLYERLLMGSCI